MAITETYVDPAIAGASGAGTVGDPYGDLQHALDTMTRDATNGDRINIKAGTDEILGAALTLATYGTPTVDAQLFLQGYTTAAGDGGIGGISGNATYEVLNSTTLDYIQFVDLHMHNSGSASFVVQARNFCNFIGCELDNGTGAALIKVGLYCSVTDCYFHNFDGIGLQLGQAGSIVSSCYFENGASDFTDTISVQSGCYVFNNIISIDGASDGIVLNGIGHVASNNTVYSSSGTGDGITSGDNSVIINNYIEGFSGAGGVGMLIPTGKVVPLLQANRYYNSTTNESIVGVVVNDTDNSAVGSSALTNPGAGDFSVGTDLKAGAYPTTFKGSSTSQYMDIGAAQRQEPAGGAGGGRQGLHSIESGAV